MQINSGRIRALTNTLFLLLIGIAVGVMLVSEFRLMPVGQADIQSKKAEISPAPFPPGSPSFVHIAKNVTPAVVNIATTRIVKGRRAPEFPLDNPFFRDFFGYDPFERHSRRSPDRKEQSLGSGVIVASDGLIVTNNHVINEADDIRVLLKDGREFSGKMIGKDKKSDIAVIRIEATDLPTISWGDSDRLEVGEYVVAVGNPFGLNQTVTMGIVSAVGRANVGIAEYEDFIQTDAAINPGNSGGAMVNTQGELVGINTAIFTRSGGYMGIGFAVPSNMVRSVVDSLLKTGKVIRGWLGVSIQNVSSALAKEFGLNEAKGALVTDVVENSPAEEAKLQRGDIIISFMGQPIEDASHLRNLVARAKVGLKIPLIVIRDKEEKTFSVTIAAQPKEIGGEEGTEESESSVQLGMDAQDITSELAKQFNLSPHDRGVVITRVAEGGIAEESGLMEGDVILEVNRQKIHSYREYEKVIASIGEGESVLFLINRHGSRFFLTLGFSER